MTNIIIAKLESYPSDEPTGWAVGFNVTCDNGRTFYIDTPVSYDEAKTDEEAVDKAYEKLKESIDTQIKELEEKSPLLGKKIDV